MPRSRAALLAVLAISSSGVATAQRPRTRAPIAQEPALEVVAAFDRLKKRDLWPGFRPDPIPLAIYDGRRTWLVRHPSPPNEFRPERLGSGGPA